MRRVILFLAAAAGTLIPSAADARYELVGPGHATFHAIGPAGMKIDGSTSAVQVDESGDQIVVTVNLASLETGIALRDKHMREKHLEVAKFPNAVLRVARASVRLPDGPEDVRARVATSVEIHGVTKNMQVDYSAHRAGPDVQVSGRIHVNMNDFGIATPGYLGVTVKPEVDVDVVLPVRDR